MILPIGVLSAWGAIKAMSFDNSRHLAAEPLSSLQCPAIITSSETGTIYAAFSNIKKVDATLDTRTTITNGSNGEPETIDTELLLGPEETQVLTWEVNAQNAGVDHFILARVHQLASASQPLKNASCAIFVINLPFLTGRQVILLSLGMAFFLSAGGILLFALRNQSGRWKSPGVKRLLILLTVTYLFAAAGLKGYWGFALFVLIVWLMLVFEIIIFFASLNRPPVQE